MPLPIWILTGPTASGKTDVALSIAESIRAEIISADSMLVYRGMDIGTEKPPAAMQRKVRHHLIDVVDPWEEYSVGRYVKDFERVTNDLHQKGTPFIVVGGTALYLKAIVDGLFEGPPADWDYRTYLRDIAAAQGPDSLHKMLADVDAEAARKLHSNDHVRIIRALEVIKSTGQRISTLQTQFGKRNPKYDCVMMAIEHDRALLYRRIETRVDNMLQRGLIEEVSALLAHPKGLSRQASQALGYKEVIDFLNGKYTPQEVSLVIKQSTRRFAKRQMTWFRSFHDIHWIQASAGDEPSKLSESILAGFRHYTPLANN